jgi:hypothetical protein
MRPALFRTFFEQIPGQMPSHVTERTHRRLDRRYVAPAATRREEE